MPASNPFYEDIEHLYALGITQGCGTSGGQLLSCPKAFVPREQMAAFLIRAFASFSRGDIWVTTQRPFATVSSLDSVAR